MSQPLVSVIVFCYNQEQYVSEALHSAFSQDYGNIEFVISDDASIDGTFAAIEKTVGANKAGRRISLNRNALNLGIAAHLDTLYRIASGELLVNAAGDDLSCPDRVATLVEAWCRYGRAPSLIYSNAANFTAVHAFSGYQ